MAGGMRKYSVVEAGNLGFGQVGSLFLDASGAASPPTGLKFIAITFLEDTTFNTGASGLIPETAQLYPSSDGASTDIDANGGVAVDGETFPKGLTIYGRWTGFQLATGGVIAYIGY